MTIIISLHFKQKPVPAKSVGLRTLHGRFYKSSLTSDGIKET